LIESAELLASIISKREQQVLRWERETGLKARQTMPVAERRAAILAHWTPIWSQLEQAVRGWDDALRPTGFSITVGARGGMGMETTIARYEINIADAARPDYAPGAMVVTLNNRADIQVAWSIPKSQDTKGQAGKPETGELSIFDDDPLKLLWDKISGYIGETAT
jgi:hypothetical protein